MMLFVRRTIPFSLPPRTVLCRFSSSSRPPSTFPSPSPSPSPSPLLSPFSFPFPSTRTSPTAISPVQRRFSSTSSSTPSTTSSATTPLSISHAVAQATDLLPNQAILENFIHQNPLKNLESIRFNEAIELAHRLESHMSPGERVYHLTRVDPRKRVHEALAELSSVFLDRGASKWTPRFRDRGFLYFFATLEGLGYAPWRKHARRAALRILAQLEERGDPEKIAETILEQNLEFFGVPREDWVDTIRSMLLEVHGWAGMFLRMETRRTEAPAGTKVRLTEFCAVQAILSRASMTALALTSGWEAHEVAFSEWLRNAPKEKPHEALAQHTSAIAFVDQNSERRETLEAEFENMLLEAIERNKRRDDIQHRPAMQLYTCIDDRECSLRRYIEQADPQEIETFGVAGFFGLPIRYKPVDGRDEMILAPDGQQPTAVLVERECAAHKHEVASFTRRRKFFARFGMLWETASFSPTGSLLLSFFSPLSITRLLLMGFAPHAKQNIKNHFRQIFTPKPRTDFDLPFSHQHAALLLARTFTDIGTQQRFARIVIVLGHGASSVNNPYAAAYNCGACGGRDGGPNARLLARLANDKTVRTHLRTDHAIAIPDDTVFVGGSHNTTSDTVEFYDVDVLPESHRVEFARVQQIINEACGKNAFERCHRFLLANVNTTEEALRHVRTRSIDAAEVRPELNHATNAGVIIGRRSLSKGTFLDRRVFLPAYDPYSDDDAGTNLEHVLAPALVVCSGINLEYLFSTIDADHHGAGTKAPLNIVGNIGVLQGTSGDLRPGLPSQMTEMHIPVRALYIVDAPVKRMEAVLKRREDLRHLVYNEWVRMIVRDTETGRFYRQVRGEYVPITVDASAAQITQYDSFKHHRTHGLTIARREDIIYWTATYGMLTACIVPIYTFGDNAMNPHGTLIAMCATLLALPILAFSRRYLHGEFMFARFSFLSVGLLLGFNLVATAPTLVHAVGGWSLFGFASTFLIGAYNDRPTVRNNATFAFAAYKISDFAMIVAAAFSAQHAVAGGAAHPGLVAAGLLVAALFKSSQFPLAALFLRSMEGPTPASALGYAGLSAHVGIILLTSTMPLWFGYTWVRVTLGSVGLFTAVYASLISRIRADRKGAIARATSATIGLIFVTLAFGYPELALIMSLGHAAFRMIQILHAPNIIAHTEALRSALRYTNSKTVPDWLFRFTWRLRRIDTDFHLLHVLHKISSRLITQQPWKLTKLQQWGITGVGVVLAGLPFTPLSHYMEELLMTLLQTHPFLAMAIMGVHFALSVVCVRFLLVKVLSAQRFRRKFPKIDSNKI